MNLRSMLLGAFVLALIAAPVPAADKDAPKKFKYLKVVVDGKEMPKTDLAEMLLTVNKEHEGVVTKGDKVLFKGKAKMDMSTTPWKIDITLTEGDDKGKTMKGIMEMDEKGKKMKVCWGAAGKARPKKFTSKEGSGHILEILEEVE
jgi:uncharacterized protein (TIGR03067 family)